MKKSQINIWCFWWNKLEPDQHETSPCLIAPYLRFSSSCHAASLWRHWRGRIRLFYTSYHQTVKHLKLTVWSVKFSPEIKSVFHFDSIYFYFINHCLLGHTPVTTNNSKGIAHTNKACNKSTPGKAVIIPPHIHRVETRWITHRFLMRKKERSLYNLKSDFNFSCRLQRIRALEKRALFL